MGNSCSESFDFKTRALKPEMHIRDFKDTYKFLKFPKSLAFTNDTSIFRLRHRLSEEHYILKRIVFSTEKDLSLFLSRLDKLIFLEHDNLLKIYNYAVERNQLKDTNVSFTLNVVLENFDHTLKDEISWRVQKEKTFKDGLIKNFLVCLTDALEFLQLKNISIGNLKPSTIYITSDGHPKLMYLGSLPSTSHHTEEVQTPSLTQLRYMSPQARTNFTETFFPEKQTSPSEPSAGLMPSPNSQFKSDVFSLGLIILEMMSMKSINGLNGNDCSNMRQYRVIQCDKEFEAWFCNVVELMLKENEANRPDFLDLKKLLIMEECMEFTKGLGKDNSQLTGNNAEKYKGNIEMKMMKNRSEFRLPAKFFVEPSDYSDTSLLTEISQEEKTSYERSKAKTGDIVPDLSPTKLSTDVSGETSGKKKTNEMLLKDLEEKEEDAIEEILIEKEKELVSLYTDKINKIRKLGVSMEEKQLSKETLSMLSEFIKTQVHLNELVVAIPNTKLTDTGLGTISEGVTGIQEIVRCYFDFRKTKITDVGLQLFGKCLTDKPKLAQFGANFSDNKITSKGCEEIAKWFEYFGNIKSLALNIGGNRIGDDGLVVIGDALEKLRELEIIMVFVHNCEIEGKEGLIAFFEGLNKIEKLRKMNLDFASNLLEDKEIELIIKYLEDNMADEISINLKDNCVSEETRTYLKGKLAKKENLNVIF